MVTRPQKIHSWRNAGNGIRGLLVYCRDYKCSHNIRPEEADKWPDDGCRTSSRDSSARSAARRQYHGRSRAAEDGNTNMKFVDPRPFADPEPAARKLMEIANSIEPRPHTYRADQLAVPARAAWQSGRVQGRSRLGDRTRPAVAPRERHLCEAHPGRLRAVRMTIALSLC